MQTDEHDHRDPKSLPMRQLLARAGLPGLIDPLVDGVDRARAALEQRREDHGLEEQVEGGNADALEHEVRRQASRFAPRDRRRPSE